MKIQASRFIVLYAVLAFVAGVCPSYAQDVATDDPAVVADTLVVVPVPSEEGLNQLSPELIQATADKINQTEPLLRTPPIEEKTFYDGDALVPSGEMGATAPRRANPRLEPGSRMVVVTKNHGADAPTSQIVAAARAMKLGRYDAALDIYDRLYARSKKDPNVLLGRASALQNAGRNEEAIVAYEELLTLRPNQIEAQINMLGLMADKYPAVALRRLLELREKNSQSSGVAAQIAVVYASMGKYEDAIQNLGIAASMEPQNAGHIYNMAVIADRAGSKADAVKYYEQALEVDTIYGGAHSIPRDSVFERLAQLR